MCIISSLLITVGVRKCSDCLQENGWHGREFGRGQSRPRPTFEPTPPPQVVRTKNRVVSRELSSGELVKSLVLSDRTRTGTRGYTHKHLTVATFRARRRRANFFERGSDEQSEQDQLVGMGCEARKQGWTRLSGAMCMLVSRAPSSWDQLTLAAACARVILHIHPGLKRVL